MNPVQKAGEQAVFMGIGASKHACAHHQPHFDISEEVMWKMAGILAGISVLQ